LGSLLGSYGVKDGKEAEDDGQPVKKTGEDRKI
jgi:hypothetical protein